MSPVGDLQELEDLLLLFGREELEAERTLKHIQIQIRSLSAAGDDAGADAAADRYEHLYDQLVGIRKHIYSLETLLYSARRRQRQ